MIGVGALKLLPTTHWRLRARSELIE
jgi:hypothetical protein